MTNKKKLIARLAEWSGAVLAVALLAIAGGFLKEHKDRERFEARQAQARTETLERSRRYLAELAERIDSLPADPAVVAEIESRYFEERSTGPMQVWGMGTDGAFLFGVPGATFQRLNAIYDREVFPRLDEGLFLDRQTFLLGHLDEGEDLELASDLLAGGDGKAEDAEVTRMAWQRLAGDAFHRRDSFILSSPLRGADGSALGSLYLRRTPADRDRYRPDDRLEAAGSVVGAAAVVSILLLWVLLPTWVYVDARQRGARRAPLFAFLTAISSVVGLLVYLIARPEDVPFLACPGCGRELNGGAWCPHCGQDLSASFCSACRYPLKPDWVFCPSCRAEIRPPVAGSPTAADQPAG